MIILPPRYLDNVLATRPIQVHIGNTLSNDDPAHSDDLQGSVIDTLLLIVMI